LLLIYWERAETSAGGGRSPMSPPGA